MQLFDRIRMDAKHADRWLAAHFGVDKLDRLSPAQCDHAIELLTIGRTLKLEAAADCEE